MNWDRIYRTTTAKERAILTDIKDCAARGQPVLIGTTMIEDSEKLSEKLSAAGLAHEILNAKQHAREAQIIAQAGNPAPSPSPPTWPDAAPTSF